MLEIRNVNASIEQVQVLRDVSLTVETGETIGIVGSNGAGKTTLFRTILGLIDDADGEIRFDDQDLTPLEPFERARRGIGFCPEERRLISRFTARENIQLPSWHAGKTTDERSQEAFIDHILSVFPEIESFLDRRGSHLSGGQQQMVAVSRALAGDPDLVLLDEPFEGLAPSVRSNLRDGLRELQQSEKTFVIAESELNHMTDLVDRVYLISRGEIIHEAADVSTVLEDDDLMRKIEG